MSEEKISPTDAKEGLGEEELNEQMAVRLEKARKLEEKGILPFGHAYEVTHHTKEVHDQVEAMEAAGTVVKVAGRLMAIRGHGKNLLYGFCRIKPVRFSCMSARTKWAKTPTA